MARRFTTFIALAFGLLSGQPALFSQEQVKIHFRTFGVGMDSFEGLYYNDGKEFISLEFEKTSRSSIDYQYSGTPQISIFTRNSTYQEHEPNSQEFLPLAKLRINRSLENALLLLVAHPENRQFLKEERQYKIFLLDDSPEAFPSNSINVINATEVDLYGKVANAKITLPRNSNQLVNYSSFTSRNKPIPIAFAFNTDDGPRLTMSNEVPLSLNRRVILILMNPRREGSIRIEVRTLIDLLAPKEAGAE